MDWQISNSLFIAVTTLAVFATAGIVAKITIKQIRWKWLGVWMMLGITTVIMQIQGASSPKLTVKSTIPSTPTKSLEITEEELVEKRDFKEWRERTESFDAEQDKRIKENK